MASAPTDGSREGPTAPMLEQVLPLLLHGDHLTAKDQLACFGTSMAFACMVLPHAPCTRLLLTLGGEAGGDDDASGDDGDIAGEAQAGDGGETPGDEAQPGSSTSNTSKGGGGGSTSTQIAQQLAAKCRNVVLTLQGGLLTTPAPCLWQRITSLHLQNMELTPEDLSSRSQLQLHKLPHLHTVSLQACSMDTDEDSIPEPSALQGPLAGSSPPLASSVRTLKCMECEPASGPFVRMALALVDPGQLQTLITDDEEATEFISLMPALQEVQVHKGGEDLSEDTFEHLLAHPGVTRVSLSSLYTEEPCRWMDLQLTLGANTLNLAALPASIPSVTVHNNLFVMGSDNIATVTNGLPNVSFQSSGMDSCPWEPQQTTFTMDIFGASNIGGVDLEDPEIAQVVASVMGRLSGGGALVVNCDSSYPPVVMASLATVPATFTTVCFQLEHFEERAVEVVGAQVMAVAVQLPVHVTHVILRSRQFGFPEASVERWLSLVGWFMRSVTRPMRVTLFHENKEYVWPEGLDEAVRGGCPHMPMIRYRWTFYPPSSNLGL